jgi:dipeptidyl aminopeptidase/acylaminoacyl peptidase
MGGALALLLSSKFGKPAIAVAPPTDLRDQMEYMKQALPSVYQEIASSTNLEELYSLSPINLEYSAPILVIHGSEDNVVPVDQSIKFCKKVPNCELIVIEGMGHKPTSEEEKESVRRAVVDFLRSVEEYFT